MKNLENFIDDINNCSRCGLCQSVCPVFNLTKNDCNSPKGKFTMLKELLVTKSKASKILKEYMNSCINCKKCFDFCPSRLDIVKVNASFNKKYSKLFLPSIKNLEMILSVLSFFIKTHRFFKIDKIILNHKKIFYKLGFVGKYILLFNYFIHQNINQKSLKKLANPEYKVLFFQGCVNKYINPSQKNALLQILNENNVEVKVGDFTCCGRLYYLLGKEKEYNKIAEKNRNIINNTDYDYVIFDCVTCYDTVLNYENIDTSKIILLEDFLSKLNINIEKKEKITYFKPCLLNNYPEILKKLNYEKIDDGNNCCGMALPFSIYNQQLSTQISNNNVKKLLQFSSDYILTNCSMCKLGLYKGVILNEENIDILSMGEFLSK